MNGIGTMILTRLRDDDVRVEHADDLIEVSNELLRQITKEESPQAIFDGELLEIHATNGTWVYRLCDNQFGRAYPGTKLMERVS